MERDRILRESADNERRAAEEEERVREQRAAELADEQQMEEALALSRSLTREREVNELRERFAPEPAEGSDVSLVRFQLPRGGKLSRRFRKTDTIQVLYMIVTLFGGVH